MKNQKENHKANHSFDKKNCNILNMHFSDEEKKNNFGNNKKKKFNTKIIKIKIHSSKEKSDTNDNFEMTLKATHSQLSIKSNNYNNSEIITSKSNLESTNTNNKIKNLKKNSSKPKYNEFLDINVNRMDLEFNKSDFIDKSCENWEEVRKQYIEHIKNEKIFKKYENKKICNDHRKFYFGRQKVYDLPYVYDISSTYMNKYNNRSEHKRHELLIDELCKLRAYLTNYPNNNNIDIIKDFLIKYNIPNVDKYSNYQLLQLGKFVCQEDIYKINSLLKPYLHMKDMIYDILENSVDLNYKFKGYKFNSIIDKKLKQIYLKKNHENINKSTEILDKKKENEDKNKNKGNNNKYFKIENFDIFDHKKQYLRNNKKFYISELDCGINSSDITDRNIISSNKNNDEEFEKCAEIKTQNHNDFIKYSKKRKELLDSIGLFINTKRYENKDNKSDLYTSPLNKKKKSIYQKYKINNKLIKLPKINNKGLFYYKPNKLLLAPDKDYSSHFNLLLRDTSNELKEFENSYKEKLDMICKRNSNKNSKMKLRKNNKPLIHSQSCSQIDNNDINKIKKLEAVNRLYYGKKTIKLQFTDIQKKNKLTEFFALVNAKKHIKDEIINDNVIKKI